MRGFSTLEILIAMAIMTSTLSAVILVSFGNQSLLAQGGAQSEAVQYAQALLEDDMESARVDFRLVHNATSSDGMYEKSLLVSDIASDSYTSKRLTAAVSWQDNLHTKRTVSLTTLVTDFGDASTTDTCDSFLSGDWTSPSIRNYVLLAGDLLPSSAPSGHNFSAINPIASVDAYHSRLYVGVSKKVLAGNDSLFVFDTSDATHEPVYLGSINNNASVTEGVNGIMVAGNYLYADNTHVSNFKTCKPSTNCSQLQIFDVSSPASILNITNFLIPTSSTPFVTGTSTSQALGNSLFYADGYVYLGLTKTATGPEFNIIDVHNPLNPQWVGGFKIGASINQIYVHDGYAYVTDDDKSRELVILDVHNPASPILGSTFDPSGTLGYEVGKSIYKRGDVLFVGMSFAFGSPELYVLNVANQSSPLHTGSRAVGATILGMFARDSILFVLASSVQQFQMLDISDPTSPSSYGSSLPLPGIGASLDCEGNYFFVGSNANTTGNISIIGPHI